MRTSGLIAYMTILIALYRGTMLWLGKETVNNISEFMFGPYVDLYNLHFRQMMPGWDSPFVIIVILALAVMFFWNWFSVSRTIASFVIALFVFDMGFWYLDPTRAQQPDPDWLLFSLIALGWLMLAHAISEQLFWAWLRDKREGRV